ncbi:MAG: hypothetical protein ACI4AH_00775 [Muribaculaceae bacterium]
MGNYFEPVLTEEQMAAYLDGMLTDEESSMVEELISSVPELSEIEDVIASVDASYIIEVDNEVPIECMADDFVLPEIGVEHSSVADDADNSHLYLGSSTYEASDSDDDMKDDGDDDDGDGDSDDDLTGYMGGDDSSDDDMACVVDDFTV